MASVSVVNAAQETLLKHFQNSARDPALSRRITEIYLETIEDGQKPHEEVLKLFHKDSKEIWERTAWSVLHLSDPDAQSEAIQCLQAAAEANYPTAQYILAACLQRGYGIPKNIPRSNELFEKACKHGHAGAQTLIGFRLYHDGDAQKEIHLLEKAAEQEYGEAIAFLRIIREEASRDSLDQDESAKQQALAEHGFCLINGHGVQRDLSQGLLVLEEAAMKGNAKALHFIGLRLFRNGSTEQGLDFLRQAAAKEYSQAQMFVSYYDAGLIS